MTPPIPTKSVFVSKTALLAVLTSIAGLVGSFYPQAGDFLRGNMEMILTVIGVLNFLLRLISRGKVTLTGE